MSQPDISNLSNCTEDARRGGLDQDPGPPDPTEFNPLRGRLQASKPKIPTPFLDSAFTPYVQKLDDLGETEFTRILLNDPDREAAGGLMMDIAQAFLQRGESFEPRARAAFQEVVADLYDGFLGAESRGGVAPPDRETLPPMVKFGNPAFGPYTWPADATAGFGLQVAVVNMPPANARQGLLSWAALAHETSGHDILHADIGLLNEVSSAVRSALSADTTTRSLAPYWASRIDETASDVLGILNMGPTPAIGLIGYFRGLSAAATGKAKLRSSGPANDPHPADVLRGFLGAQTVRHLLFSEASAWADLIDAETMRDVAPIRLAGKSVPLAAARRSAEIVADTIVTHPMQALESHAFGEIQNWRDEDEEIVDRLRNTLATTAPIPSDIAGRVFAAHVVAASTVSALAPGANIPLLFSRMLDLLKGLHDTNPSFGPLRVRHRGDMVMDRAYVSYREEEMAEAVSA